MQIESVDIERASSADVTELVCDISGTSMQVALVLVLDGSVDPTVARQAIADRIPAIPRLRQRLVHPPFGCGRPVWLDDAEFDLTRHFRSVPCPAPGDERAMLAIVADAVTRLLPPEEPLWSATLITGLAAGRVALVLVVHHVLTDGIGGLAILGQLADGPPCVDPAFPRRWPRHRELLLDAFRSRGRAIAAMPAGVGRLRSATAELGARHGPARAPRTSINRPVGRRRLLALVRTDLAAVQQAAHAQGGTVNDVIVTAVAGALGTVLADRGELVDRLVVSMPVSARRQTGATELGNQVGVIPVSVPTTGDPHRRLAAVARITRGAKTATPGASGALLGPVFRGLARVGVFGWFINHQHLITTFVSNLRGPQHRMTFLGARVVDMVPVSMLTGNVAVAFTALSYAGTLLVTVVADPAQFAELPLLQSALRDEFEVLSRRDEDGVRTAPDKGREPDDVPA